MSAVRPRTLAFHGSLDAIGLVIDLAICGDDVGARRVLAAWRSGTTVARSGSRLLVRWSEPSRVDADDLDGAPVVQVGRSLVAAPLTVAEVAALSPPSESLVVVRAGGAVVEALDDWAPLDPATWLDVDDVPLERAKAFAPTGARAIELVIAEPTTVEAATNAIRAAVGPLAAERQSVALAIDQAKRFGPNVRPTNVGARVAGVVSSVLGLLAGVRRAFRSSVGTGPSTGAAPPSSALAVANANENSSAAVWIQKVARLARHLFAQLLFQTRLASLVGRRNAEYLAKTLNLFERGDLDEALRTAIPLGGAGGGAPSLGLPARRATLVLTGRTGAAKSSLHLVDDLYAHLRQTYRAAFERLDRDGDVDRAAFVLAELLRVTEEAVAYLEKKKKFKLAADLAEARGLPPDLVVRLRFRAGERSRAIELALRFGCFALAVERLERDDRDAASALRLLWADHCASAGDYVTAIDTLWGLPSGGALLGSWVARAADSGGVSAASVLMRELALAPASFPDVRRRALALLASRAAIDEPAKGALLRRLADATDLPGARPLARAAVRLVAADESALPRGLLERLVACAADGPLRRDATGRRTFTSPAEITKREPRTHRHRLGDAGTSPVHDVVLVGGNRLLVALGELGARLLSLDGRPLARFDAPAHSLVVSTHGDRALALARRDGALEITRIDVAGRRAKRWGVLDVGAYAREFDGATWFVARAGEILALDATSDDLHATWRSGSERGDRIVALATSASSLVAYAQTTDGIQRHLFAFYELPSITLRGRAPLSDAAAHVAWPCASGGFAVESTAAGERWEVSHAPRGKPPIALVTSPAPILRVDAACTDEAWCVTGEEESGDAFARFGALSIGASVETGSVTFGDTPRLSARLAEGHVCFGDGLGRIVVYETGSGAIAADIRIRT